MSEPTRNAVANDTKSVTTRNNGMSKRRGNFLAANDMEFVRNQAHHISAGFSLIRHLLSISTALDRPSFWLMRLSSCSIERT